MDTTVIARAVSPSAPFPDMSASDAKTLDAIFRHPTAHNLAWSDVVALFRRGGTVDESSDGGLSLVVGGLRHHTGAHRGKQLETPELMELRHFLTRAGWAPGHRLETGAASAEAVEPMLLAVVDHHEARIYRIDNDAPAGPSRVIRPHDPHHFLHHLEHRDQSRERGQRAPEDDDYYGRIAQALAAGGKIVLVGHGTGKSNAAHHLADYLSAHDVETYNRVACELVEDLSSITEHQLLRLAERSVH